MVIDTSALAELHDIGLTPVEIISRHSRLGSSLNDPSSYHSSVAQTDHASTVSKSSGAAAAAAAAAAQVRVSPFDSPAAGSLHELPSPPTETASPSDDDQIRPDSPPLGREGPAVGRQASLRQGNGRGSRQQTGGGGNGARQSGSGVSEVSEADRAHLRQISDATVSSVGTQGGGDRVLPEAGGQGPASSPLRRSVFRESREDMGGGKGT